MTMDWDIELFNPVPVPTGNGLYYEGNLVNGDRCTTGYVVSETFYHGRNYVECDDGKCYLLK